MKKVLRIIPAALVSAAMMGGVAAADASISNTGPGSTNTINADSSNTLVSHCSNTVSLLNSNVQNAGSGSANVSGNTTGGSASSGSASNNNSSNFSVNTSCGQASSVSSGGQGGGSTVVASANQPAGGRGAAAPAPHPVSQVAALPETGSDTLVNALVTSAVVVGGALAATQIGASVYRHRALQ